MGLKRAGQFVRETVLKAGGLGRPLWGMATSGQKRWSSTTTLSGSVGLSDGNPVQSRGYKMEEDDVADGPEFWNPTKSIPPTTLVAERLARPVVAKTPNMPNIWMEAARVARAEVEVKINVEQEKAADKRAYEKLRLETGIDVQKLSKDNFDALEKRVDLSPAEKELAAAIHKREFLAMHDSREIPGLIKSGVIRSNEIIRKRAAIGEMEPSGLTNLHDRNKGFVFSYLKTKEPTQLTGRVFFNFDAVADRSYVTDYDPESGRKFSEVFGSFAEAITVGKTVCMRVIDHTGIHFIFSEGGRKTKELHYKPEEQILAGEHIRDGLAKRFVELVRCFDEAGQKEIFADPKRAKEIFDKLFPTLELKTPNEVHLTHGKDWFYPDSGKKTMYTKDSQAAMAAEVNGAGYWEKREALKVQNDAFSSPVF